MAFPQTAYALKPVTALPGQDMDPAMAGRHVESWVASEAIPFGCAVEFNSGKVRRPQQASTALDFQGVALYSSAKEPDSGGGYVAGDLVPVMRKGRVACVWTGTTVVENAVPKVRHSSTIATNRGYFTDAAEDASAGTEIHNAPNGVRMRGTAVLETGLVEIELNVPA